MDSVNFTVLGDQSIADGFGKKGTETDLTLYDKKEGGVIRTWVAPRGFPEKIQPLLQAINLAEYAVMHVTNLDKFAGEQMVALDILGRREGILSHSYEVDESRLESMIRGTVLQGYKRVAPAELSSNMGEFAPVHSDGRTKIIIDHCFDVRGTGTVVLGKVCTGMVRQYQEMLLLPSGARVTVKSIQMHDEPVSEAGSPARVGLSLKGVRPEDVTRGDVLYEDDSIPVRSTLGIDFTMCPFYKGGLGKGQGCLLNVGLQVRAARIASVEPMSLELDKPIVCESGETAVILRPESADIRIVGGGAVC